MIDLESEALNILGEDGSLAAMDSRNKSLKKAVKGALVSLNDSGFDFCYIKDILKKIDWKKSVGFGLNSTPTGYKPFDHRIDKTKTNNIYYITNNNNEKIVFDTKETPLGLEIKPRLNPENGEYTFRFIKNYNSSTIDKIELLDIDPLQKEFITYRVAYLYAHYASVDIRDEKLIFLEGEIRNLRQILMNKNHNPIEIQRKSIV